MTQICKTCGYYRPGLSHTPQCGRDVTPVMGLPARSCETERLSGFANIETARDCATALDACGPDGRFWVAMPESKPPAWKFWRHATKET